MRRKLNAGPNLVGTGALCSLQALAESRWWHNQGLRVEVFFFLGFVDVGLVRHGYLHKPGVDLCEEKQIKIVAFIKTLRFRSLYKAYSKKRIG